MVRGLEDCLAITDKDREKLKTFFEKHWGSSEMIISSGTYYCDTLDGFYIQESGEIIALITYVVEKDYLEIISLNSIQENKGLASLLLEKVETFSLERNNREVHLITTNDNLNALKFYQKRGYRMVAVYQGAVDSARRRKPSIPVIGDNEIPLHDELLLVKK